MGKKITGLVELDATPDDADILPIVDDVSGTPVTKKVTVANLKASSFPVSDTTAIVKGSADASKLLRIEVDGFTAETERVLTPQDKNYVIAEAGVNSSITEMTGLSTNGVPLDAVTTSLNTLDVRDFIHDDGSGTNNVISTMAFIPKFVTSGWPQAALNGLEVGGFWMDVYEASQPDATSESRGGTTADTPGAVAACSRSGVVPWTDISWISARIAASNRSINGRSCHLVTPFERFAVMSWVMQSGNWGNVRGNNNNGKDTRDADTWGSYGIFDPVHPAYRTLTGSGPASWWSGGVIGQGINNLVANIYEWEDCRIESGLIQPKAYLAGATTAADTYIDYDDNAGGDAANIHQLTPGVYTITDGTNGNEDVTIERVIITGRFTGRAILAAGMATDHIDNALMQLKTAIDLCQDDAGAWKVIGKLLEDATSKYMALPDYSDVSTYTSTYLDSWYAYDAGDSRALRRCGYWGHTTKARSGLVVITDSLPTSTLYGIGFRVALSISNL